MILAMMFAQRFAGLVRLALVGLILVIGFSACDQGSGTSLPSGASRPATAVREGNQANVGQSPATVSEVGPVPVCQEDQPCWDCATMGNLVCGPVLDTVHGRVYH